MEELKVTEMTGSEKQIAWATDIITAPYNRMINNAESDERIGGEYHNAKASVRRKAAAMYKKSYEENAHNMTKASWVIDNKHAFSGVMSECVRLSIEGTEFHLYDFEQNF